MMSCMSNREFIVARASAYRLLLASLNQDTDAMHLIHQELEPEILERPDRLVDVLGVMLGVATSLMTNYHGGDRTRAIKALEPKLAEAVDALTDDAI